MWWIIGGAVLLGIFLFFRGAAKFSQRQSVTTMLASQVRLALLSASVSLLEIDEDLWFDRYILGFVQGMVALGAKFYGGPMTVEQKGMVLVEVLKGMRPFDWESVCDRIIQEAHAQHPDFVMGSEHAGNVMGLLTQKLRPEFMVDPDIQAAMAEVPSTERLHAALYGNQTGGSDPYATAANTLMFNYMRRHKEAGLVAAI